MLFKYVHGFGYVGGKLFSEKYLKGNTFPNFMFIFLIVKKISKKVYRFLKQNILN
jgi:hypothetical protein